MKVVIDGTNLLFRVLSLEVFRKMVVANVPVGGLYGFLNSFLMYKEKIKDGDFVVVWDGGRSERRKKLSEGVYKRNRVIDESFLKLVSNQREVCSKVLSWLGVKEIRIQGKEGDDVIYEIVKFWKDKDEVLIVSTDKDFFQLLSDRVKILRAGKFKMYTKEDVEKSLGLSIEWYVYLKALEGDVSDNIVKIGFSTKKFLKLLVKECDGDKRKVFRVLREIYGYRFLVNFRLIKLGEEDFTEEQLSQIKRVLLEGKVPDLEMVERVLKVYKMYFLLKRFRRIYGKS